MKIGKKIKETFTSPESYQVLGVTLLTDKEKEEFGRISSPEQLLDFISDYNHRLIQEGDEDRFSIVKYKGKQEIYGKTILLPYPVHMTGKRSSRVSILRKPFLLNLREYQSHTLNIQE